MAELSDEQATAWSTDVAIGSSDMKLTEPATCGTLVGDLQSPLLRLPGELRKMVYQRVLCPDIVNLVLKEPKDFQITSDMATSTEPKQLRQFDSDFRVAGRPRMARTFEVLQRANHFETINHLKSKDVSSAFLRVCKMVYEEAASLLYSENIFCVYAELLPFVDGMLASIASVNVASIRFLHIFYFRTSIIDLSYRLMIPRNPLPKLWHHFPGLQELKVWRPQEDLDDECRDRNIVDADMNSTKQASRERTSRTFVRALLGINLLIFSSSKAGKVFIGRGHRYVRWVKGEKDSKIPAGVSDPVSYTAT